MALVSIIMPAYNAEKYIEECLESVRAQSFEDWELIAIDDGSLDSTSQILDRYAGEDSRIKVIHQNNRGVSAARNAGLEEVTGRYIAFVDADDVLPVDSLSVRVNLMEDVDMVVAGYELYNETSVLDRMPECRSESWNTHEAVRNIIVAGEAGYQGYLVNKLFRDEIVKKGQLRFREGVCFNEDRLYGVEYAMCCNNVRITNEVVYRYRITQTNATSSLPHMLDSDLSRFMSEFVAYDHMLEAVKGKYQDCFFLCSVEAQYRAVILKRIANKQARGIRKGLNQMIRKYGSIALKAPLRYVRLRKKLSVLGHAILLR